MHTGLLSPRGLVLDAAGPLPPGVGGCDGIPPAGYTAGMQKIILLCEDDPDLAKLMATILLLDTCAPDLLLTDLQLPGTDGLTVALRLRGLGDPARRRQAGTFSGPGHRARSMRARRISPISWARLSFAA